MALLIGDSGAAPSVRFDALHRFHRLAVGAGVASTELVERLDFGFRIDAERRRTAAAAEGFAPSGRRAVACRGAAGPPPGHNASTPEPPAGAR